MGILREARKTHGSARDAKQVSSAEYELWQLNLSTPGNQALIGGVPLAFALRILEQTAKGARERPLP